MGDVEGQRKGQQKGPQLRQREKRRRSESPDSEDGNALTPSQNERVEMNLERLKKVDPAQHFKDKMVRREAQESLMTKIQEQFRREDGKPLPENFIPGILDDANDIFAKSELNIDAKGMRRDSELLNNVSNLLIEQTEVLLSSNMKKGYSMESFAASLSKYSDKLKKKYLLEGTESNNSFLQLIKGVDYVAPKEVDNDEGFRQENWAVLQRAFETNVMFLDYDVIKSYIDEESENDERAPTDKREKKQKKATKEDKEEAVIIKQKKGPDDAAGERTVSNEITHIRECLRRAFDENGNRVSYYNFVINPDSFGKSVENIFNTSFLIRDCYARLALHETKKIPYLYYLDEDERAGLQSTGDGETTSQQIQAFDMHLWSEFIRVLNITEPMIPPTIHDTTMAMEVDE